MDAKVIWLLVFVGLYWAYCVYWGIKGHLQAKTASDYFLAGRGISIWVRVIIQDTCRCLFQNFDSTIQS